MTRTILQMIQIGSVVCFTLISGGNASAEEPSCKGDQLAVAASAMRNAKKALDRSIEALKAPQESDQVRLSTWLGVRSSSDVDKVRLVLQKVRVFADGATFLCAVKTDMALGDVFAYVRPDTSFVIVLGDFFFAAKDTGYSAKLGVLIHEMSHFTLAGATKDPKIYGPDEAKKLAANDPKAAQNNAENIEYFVEAVNFRL